MITALGLGPGQVRQWVPDVTPSGLVRTLPEAQPNFGRMRTSPSVDLRGRTPFSAQTPMGPLPSEFDNTVTEIVMVPESEGEILKLLMTSGDLLLAYALSAYLVEGHEPAVLEAILHRCGAGESPVLVLEQVLGYDIPRLEKRLLEWLRETGGAARPSPG